MIIQFQILLILLVGSCVCGNFAFGAEIHDAAIAGSTDRMQAALSADASLIDATQKSSGAISTKGLTAGFPA